LIRFAQMGSPIFPGPIKPMVSIPILLTGAH
jgi:hypothetical protein